MSWNTLIAICRKGQAKDIMAAAREAGAPGGTVCLAKGTATHTILAALGIGDTKQEVITSVIRKEDASTILQAVKSVRAKGVAMIIDTSRENDMETIDMNSEWILIEVICEDGYSEDIMATARKAGAEGGTVIDAHGTSTEDDVKFFGSPLVPEKEILMIVISKDKADAVLKAINEMPQLKKKGMGIVFSIPVRNFISLGEK